MKQLAPTTRDRILDSGLELLSTSGLSGVTLGVLADRVGMSKSGLFAHFKSKEEVDLQLLIRTFETARRQVMNTAMKAAEGLPRLEAATLAWFGWFSKAGLPGGCPVAAAMFELDDVEGAVRDRVLAETRQWTAVMKELAEDAVARGHLRKDLDIDQFFWEIQCISLGHHVALRFFRDPHADAQAGKSFRDLIERSLPPTTGRPVRAKSKAQAKAARR